MTTCLARVVVRRPVGLVHQVWSRLELFPLVMGSVVAVTVLDDARSSWDVRVGGRRRSFVAVRTVDEPPYLLGWETVDGPATTGAVRFEPVGSERTRVTVTLDVEPEGRLEWLGVQLGVLSRRIGRELRRFRQYVEQIGTAPQLAVLPAPRSGRPPAAPQPPRTPPGQPVARPQRRPGRPREGQSLADEIFSMGKKS